MKWISSTLVFITFSTHANIYECDINGVKTYQQSECPANATNIKPVKKLTASTIRINNTPAKTAKTAKTQKDYTKELNNITAYKLKQRIKRTNKNIERLKRKMQIEINVLKNRTRYANNNLPGAVYHGALSKEMIATTNKYNTLIKDEERKIKTLNEEISQLK